MKKMKLFLLSIVCILGLSGCWKQDEFEIRISVPAGSNEEFVFSHEEISPKGKKIKLSCGEGLGDTSVVLKLVEGKQERTYEPAYLTPGISVEMEAEKGAWFQIGISVQNDTEEEQVYYVRAEGVEVRIENRVEESITYRGKEYKKSELCDETLQWLELSEEEQAVSSYFPPEFQTTENRLGITLTAENMTPTGMTLKCSQSGGAEIDELYTGSWYVIESWTQKDGWKEVDYAATEEICWDEVAWIVPLDGETEWKVDWEWLYGELPAGKYRIGKDFTSAAENEESYSAVYYVEFEIAEER